MVVNTPLQDLPIPEPTDDPDVVGDMGALANALEKRLFGVYANIADRDARITAPAEGQVAYTKDTDKVYVYTDAWTQLWPSTGLPSITSGTAAPNNADGNDDDVYFQV